MISLQNRLTLTYALFISLALAILSVIINLFTGLIFTALVKNNIAEKSGEIVRSISSQYNPMRRDFDAATIEAIGMLFVHEGYIVSVEDENGEIVWDARSCDMQQCAAVLSSISERMEKEFSLKGAVQLQEFPVLFGGQTVGTIAIETYGPFFYSETETLFLSSINRLLLVSGVVFTLLSISVSIPLSRTIASPIRKAGEAARHIAGLHARGFAGRGGPDGEVRILDRYKTRELAELSRSINELARELEEGEKRQKQLSSDIAHELRTPLTCLQGNIEAMIDGVWKPDREHLESCHEEVIRLTRLVRDLSTLTGFDQNTLILNKTDFDLAKLLRAAAGQFKAAAGEKGIEIRLSLRESPINADYDRLKQVFINLLSNAVKYTDKGSIRIVIEKADAHWDVAVSDTGIGIPRSDLPYIFDRFYRSDKSRNRGTGGAGIGLAIAAAIVAAHGGTISAESPDTGGSLFLVHL
jgi:signal transduction histidine kinase